MSERITKEHLEAVVNRMNRIVGADAFALESVGSGRYNVTTCNGSCTPLRIGGAPLSQLYHIAHAYASAMDTAFLAVERMPTHAATLRTAQTQARNALTRAFINAR